MNRSRRIHVEKAECRFISVNVQCIARTTTYDIQRSLDLVTAILSSNLFSNENTLHVFYTSYNSLSIISRYQAL